MPLQIAKGSKFFMIPTVLFAIFTTFWVAIHSFFPVHSVSYLAFSHTYGLMALCGGLIGILVAREWDGFGSMVGKAIYMFSFGLLLQSFGQFSYSFYAVFLHVELPYPSLGDIGYFGSILFYIYGTWLIGKLSGIQAQIKRSTKNKMISLSIPLIMLTLSYYAFLNNYLIDTSYPLITFLDFGYPLGQSIYIAFAISAYLVTHNFLGGKMRNRVRLVLFALLLQYLADYVFLFQANNGSWHPGNINELMYLLAYYTMTLALVSFHKPLAMINEGKISSTS